MLSRYIVHLNITELILEFNYTGIKKKKVVELEFKSKSTCDVLDYNTTLSQLRGRNRDYKREGGITVALMPRKK